MSACALIFWVNTSHLVRTKISLITPRTIQFMKKEKFKVKNVNKIGVINCCNDYKTALIIEIGLSLYELRDILIYSV